MKPIKTIVGIVISVVLIVLLLNPQWLFPASVTGSMQALESEHFLIENSGQITLSHILTLVLAVCIVWLIYTVLRLILRLIGKRSDRAGTIAQLLTGVLRYLAVIIAVIWGLSILGVNTAAVLAGVGIIGLILGFGAQSLIEDIITGFFVIFEGQYSVGDIIILDDFRGIVRSIGVRTTVIEDAGGNLKVVNNSDIRNFQNRSRVDSLAICLVSVAYDTDIRKLETLLAEHLPAMYERNRDLYLGAPYCLGVEELGDSGVLLKIVAPVREENIFPAQRRLNRDVWALFTEKGIEIPFPQVVVRSA